MIDPLKHTAEEVTRIVCLRQGPYGATAGNLCWGSRKVRAAAEAAAARQ